MIKAIEYILIVFIVISLNLFVSSCRGYPAFAGEDVLVICAIVYIFIDCKKMLKELDK